MGAEEARNMRIYHGLYEGDGEAEQEEEVVERKVELGECVEEVGVENVNGNYDFEMMAHVMP